MPPMVTAPMVSTAARMVVIQVAAHKAANTPSEDGRLVMTRTPGPPVDSMSGHRQARPSPAHKRSGS
jgi:hypothetical protein